jgi:hypothetical protein
MKVLKDRLLGVGVDMLTLVDHWKLPADPELSVSFGKWGFLKEDADSDAGQVWAHPAARLPRICLSPQIAEPELAVAVEDVARFLECTGFSARCHHGDADSAYEFAEVAIPVGKLSIVARRGYNGFLPGVSGEKGRRVLAEIRASYQSRPRRGNEKHVVSNAGARFSDAAALIGYGRAAEEFFVAERAYYLTRNSAARWQYERQQAVGIGWANHDHHTYRSSREGFQALMLLWQTMGFTFRERFYAGAEAGWGAQILEHPESRVILFCDVDLSPDELDVDFISIDLTPRDTLGTIGLWCALHGSSIAEAGMHHIECEFDFTACEAGYRSAGFGVMKPFTDLPILKQAFTEPETWPVAPDRLSALLERALITPQQSEFFASNGAPGSHLEILQRWEGFKGFNKSGVSDIIRQVDARRNVHPTQSGQ